MNYRKPWNDEPNDFMLTAFGLPVRARRHELWGHWCGFVGVPPSHPLFGHHFRDPVPHPPGMMKRPFAVDEHGALNVLTSTFDHAEWGEGYASVSLIIGAHGGLSYAGHLHGDAENWYFGFDCSHAGDLQPLALDVGIDPEWYLSVSVYRTMAFVQSECLNLAEQLAAYGSEVGDVPELKRAEQVKN